MEEIKWSMREKIIKWLIENKDKEPHSIIDIARGIKK